jgi:hypothetical protein
MDAKISSYGKLGDTTAKYEDLGHSAEVNHQLLLALLVIHNDSRQYSLIAASYTVFTRLKCYYIYNQPRC